MIWFVTKESELFLTIKIVINRSVFLRKLLSNSSMPPSIGIAIPDFGKYAPAPHDPGGGLLKMGLEAVALLTSAMDATGEERRQLFERCLQLRLREREGWLAVRTPAHPAGDLLGAAKAASGIATVYSHP